MRELFRRNSALRIGATIAIAACAATAIYAEHTRYWREASYEEFEKGTSKGVAIRSDGKIVLAPKFAALADPGLAFLWALRTDSKGNLYAAGGSGAKVLKYDAAGKMTTAFESSELSAQTIAVDSHDNLFIGTSPDGKVYEVTAAGEKKTFFEPKTKYIWDVAIDTDGTAYVATGDTGTIFAVTPDGKSTVFYKSDQANVRSLAFDHSGNLIAGTEPDGRILRIPKAAPGQGKTREGFVLYETPNEEVTSLLVDRAGNIYSASIGEKSHGATPFISAPPPVAPQTQPGTSSSSGGMTITFEGAPGQSQQSAPQTSTPYTPIQSVSGSSVYRIAPDGSPQQMWSSRDVLVYSLGFDAAGNVLLGTGNSGEVLLLGANHLFTNLEKTETAQVTGIAQQSSGKVFVCTANPAKVFALGPDDNAQGTFDSEPFDAHFFTHWGRLEWQADIPPDQEHPGPRVEFFMRAGNTSNPDENWSVWAGPYQASGDRVEIPAARYAQWRAVLHSGSGSPILDWISLSYLPKNVAPEIQAIEIQDPGVRVQVISGMPMADRSQAPVHLRLPQLPGAHTGTSFSMQPGDASGQHFDAPPQATTQKGYQSVLWLARDENDDDLVYSIYYRAENETQWKLLKNDLHDKFYSWDTTAMPDGAYYLKVVASDSPSNPPDQALETGMASDRFVVDNTAPAITGPQAEPLGDGAHVRFTAKDPGSNIARAEYSIDANDWRVVEPVGRLSDSAAESYDFVLHGLGAGEHTIAVRVYDRYENVSVGKVVFHVGGAER